MDPLNQASLTMYRFTLRPVFQVLLMAWGVFASVSPLVAESTWKPVEGTMMTEWGRKVTPDSAWQEYPRPQFVREQWTNLNGLWSYAVTPESPTPPSQWNGSILVPFSPESSLSGVGRLIEPSENLWYRRPLPPPTPGKRTLIHFEAVDYRATVWVNDQEVGQHQGGHTPFSFDITDALKPRDNMLTVRIDDDTEGYQLHGKQNLVAKGIWYTRVTGIWQTVWLEEVSPEYLVDVDYACDIHSGELRLTPRPSPATASSCQVKATLSFEGTQVGSAIGTGTLRIAVKEPKLWSPAAPNLYQVRLELLGADGSLVDRVESYTAFREFGRVQDSQGHWRFTLNGHTIFHWGPLDQGWWPDGLLTPPSDEAMLSDIVFLKEAGFNMIRKHIKVEPRRYYYHCDRMGMMMWQDQVSNGTGMKRDQLSTSPPWTRLKADPVDASWPPEHHAQWVLEYQRMVDHLRDTPCIASWVPFNEAWGQHQTMAVGKMARELDATRAINIASGGNFWPVGDVADEHHYPDPSFPLDDKRFADFVKVVGEFGGHGWPVEGHLWKVSDKNWGYGKLPQSLDEWKGRYANSLKILNDLRQQGIAAGVYTQTTDVKVEVNGLRTYDRLDKVPPTWLKEQAAILFQ